MLKNIGNVVISSMSMAFLVILSWSVAYAYGWGQAFYYGYSWWYVEVSKSNIARSIGYVLLSTLMILGFSGVSFLLVRLVKPFLSGRCLNILRSFVISAVLQLPLLFVCVLSIGSVYLFLLVAYIGLVLISTFLLRNYVEKYVTSLNPKKLWEKLMQFPHYVLTFLYVYFVLSAFLIGYVRPYFLTRFDMLEVNRQFYYILAKYDDSLILSADIHRDKENFYLYRPSNHFLLHIKANVAVESPSRCELSH